MTTLSILRRGALATVVALAIPAAAHAQRALPAAFSSVGVAPSIQVAPATAAELPTVSRAVADSAAATVTSDAKAASTATPSDHANVGPNVALMIIGGAGIITGAVIGGSGGTVLAVGGAVVGLYGLWRYLH
jgi:hypothetical protein